jgi:hypothetical protein
MADPAPASGPSLKFTMPDGSSVNATPEASFWSQDEAGRAQQSDDIYHHILQTRDYSYGSELKHGFAGMGQGLATTADKVGQMLGYSGGGPVSSAIRSVTPSDPTAPDPANPNAPKFSPAMPALIQALKDGRYKDAMGLVPRAATGAAPDMAGALAAGLGTEGAGIAPYLAARYYGDNVQSRQQANNEDPNAAPSFNAAAGAVPGTALQAILGRAGLKVPGLASVPTAAGRAAVTVGGEAVAGAAGDAVGQIGNSAGTTQGTTFDPYQSAAAGAVSGATRAASLVPGAVRDAGGAIGTALNDATLTKFTDGESATAVDRAARQIDAVQNASTRKLPTNEAANSVVQTVAERMTQTARSWVESGQISRDELRADVLPAIESARRHNQDLHEDGAGALSGVKALSLPDDVKSQFVQDLQTLNVLADASRKGRMIGPLQRAGQIAGSVGAGLGGLASGNPLAAIAGVAGHSMFGSAVGRGGAVLDNILGTSQPDAVSRASLASKYLNANGIPQSDLPLQTSLQGLQDARSGVQTSRDAQNIQVPVPTGQPDPTTGRAFDNVIGATQHAHQTGNSALYQDPRSDVAPYVITPELASNIQNPKVATRGVIETRLRQQVQQQQAAEAQQAAQAMQAQEAVQTATVRAAELKQKQTEASEAARTQQSAVFDAAEHQQDRQRGGALTPAERNAALTRNENAANTLSGQVYKGQSGTPEDQFVASNGLRGSPAIPSDPLMVTSRPQAPQRQPQGGPTASPATPVAQTTPQAPAAPGNAPTGGSGGVLPVMPWVGWLRNHLQMAGLPNDGVNYQSAVQAAHNLADRGTIPREVATALETHTAPVLADRRNIQNDPMHLIGGQLAHDLGYGSHVIQPPATPSPVLPQVAQRAQVAAAMGGPNPVRTPSQFDRVGQQVQDQIVRASTTASKAGYPALASVLDTLRGPLTAAQKTSLVQDFMSSGRSPGELALAQKLLTDPTVRRGTDMNRRGS